MYHLQSRWRLEGRVLRYYGLRNKPDLLRNTVRLSRKQKSVLERLPCELTDKEKKLLGGLIGVQVVPAEEKRRIPASFAEARFCRDCVANDFMIPGLEFDGDGLCPVCQSAEDTKDLRSILPVMNTFPRSKHSRFDVAVFYTGGKDSTYVLYYLSKVLGLRVLALTWEIPFM